MAMYNPSLILSISSLTTSSNLCNYVHAANNVFDTETCNATTASAFLTFTNFEMESKSPEFAGIVVSAKAN
jgi:hypothetical protein